MPRGFLIDTNVLSEARKGAAANAGVIAFFEAADDTSLWLSVLTLGEVRKGIEQIRRRDEPSALVLERWLTALGKRFADRMLTVDAEVADAWGRLDAQGPVPAIDGLIGATALVHDLVVVTRNERDVRRTGAPVLNPFCRPAKRAPR